MQHPIILIRSNDPLGYVPETDQEVTVFTHERLGVDEVRHINSRAHLRPVEGDEYVFVLNTLFVTHEAQNALLKLLEEPPAGLSFQIVLPAAVILLPTLMSRVGQEVYHAAHSDATAWNVFIGASPADRLKQIDDWNKTKEPQWLQSIVAGVHSLTADSLTADVLEVVRLVGEKLATRGASNKMLLEHLALALPLRK